MPYYFKGSWSASYLLSIHLAFRAMGFCDVLCGILFCFSDGWHWYWGTETTVWSRNKSNGKVSVNLSVWYRENEQERYNEAGMLWTFTGTVYKIKIKG
jgi:hypothetical protein